MNQTQADHHPATASEPHAAQSSASLILFSILIVVVYLVTKGVIYMAAWQFGVIWLPALSLLISLAGFGLTYADCPRAANILLRSIGIFCLFYVLTAHIDIPISLTRGLIYKVAGFDVAFILCIILAVAGILARPSLLYVVVNYVVYYKIVLAEISGVGVSSTDYNTLIEVGRFSVLSVVVACFLARIYRRYPTPKVRNLFLEFVQHRNRHVEFAILTAIAFHFGNYFLSGIGKFHFGDTLTFWAFENPTEFLLLSSWDTGTNPLSFSKPLFNAAYEHFALIRPLTNAATIIGQVLCIVAILRIGWSIWITVFYDLMHAVIALTTGIFFWKFIVLNAAVIAALKYMKIGRINIAAQGFLVLCVGFSFLVFETVMLAWLETRSLNQYRIFAITQSGSELEIPSNYFLGLSVTFAQNRVAWPNSGAFETQTWGTTFSTSLMRDGNRCGLPLTDGNEKETPFFKSADEISNLIQKHHRVMLSLLDKNGYYDYDLYPHHIFSMPWNYSRFKELDKRHIVKFRFQSEAVCMSISSDGPQREVKSMASFVFPAVVRHQMLWSQL